MDRRPSLLAALLLLTMPYLAAQRDSVPTFRASSTLVVVNVLVTDRYGQPVDSLSIKDFTIFEDGKKQDIRAFEHHSPAAQPAPPAVEIPPGQYTNFRTPGAGTAMNIVLFDMLNTPMMDQAYARYELMRFLKRLPPDQPIAIFTLGTRLRQVQGFTQDAEKLQQVAGGLKTGMSALTPSGARPGNDVQTTAHGFGSQDAADSRFAQAFAEEEQFQTGYRVGLTVEAIGAIARAVSGFPGRKNLLWLSAGFPLDVTPDSAITDPLRNITSFQEKVNQLGLAMASSQVAIYPIDVRGLMVAGFDAASSGDGVFNAERSMRDKSWLWSTHAMMDAIAAETGGHAFYNTNGVMEAMQKTVENASHYYTLAYVPKRKDWNSKLRSIKVTTREPYSLQYRQGYLTMPERKIAGPSSFKLLLTAMQPGFPDSTMLFLKAKVTPPDDEHPKVRIDCAIVADQLAFIDVPGKGKTATIDIVLVAFNRKGEQAGVETQRVEGTLLPQEMRQGFIIHPEINLRPGTYTLKIGVLDVNNQKMGTLDVPLVVPVTRFSPPPMPVPAKK